MNKAKEEMIKYHKDNLKKLNKRLEQFKEDKFRQKVLRENLIEALEQYKGE